MVDAGSEPTYAENTRVPLWGRDPLSPLWIRGWSPVLLDKADRNVKKINFEASHFSG